VLGGRSGMVKGELLCGKAATGHVGVATCRWKCLNGKTGLQYSSAFTTDTVYNIMCFSYKLSTQCSMF
jgi:hypothetical protein